MPFLLVLRNPGILRFLKVFSATGALKLILKIYALLKHLHPVTNPGEAAERRVTIGKTNPVFMAY